MTYWKYKYEINNSFVYNGIEMDGDEIDWLNEQGKQGWQLILKDDNKYLFKREIAHRETISK